MRVLLPPKSAFREAREILFSSWPLRSRKILHHETYSPARLLAGHRADRFCSNNSYPFPASGNVGIGTTDPQEKIHIGGSSSRLRFDSNTNIVRILLYGDGSGINDYGFGIDSTDLVSIFGAGGGMTFKTSGVDGPTLMRITGESNVGIGTTSPIAKLTIVGGSADPLQLKDSTGHSFRVGPGVGIAGGFQLYDHVAGAVRLRIDDSGNVGIGTTAPSVKLTVASPQSSVRQMP